MTSGMQLRIAHLYAHFLNIYGDRGNIISLQRRCQWRGIDTELRSIGPGDHIDPDYFDFYFVGGGQDKQQIGIAQDFLERAVTLRSAIEDGAVILSICGGYQLLGNYYRPHQGPELKGISLIDAHTVAGSKRMIGNVCVRRSNGQSLVGFENHSGKTYLAEGVSALGQVEKGNGNNGEDGNEGVCQPIGRGRVYGTYMHGSLLPKNPQLADEIILTSLRRRYGLEALSPLSDEFEMRAHDYAVRLKA